ncbi:MAG: hypothetical protein ACE5JL_13200, partial [Dehalococcoidia bacterium]
ALTGHLVEKAFGVQEITEQMMFWTLIALFIAVIHLGQREVDPSTVIGVARPPLASRLPGRRIMAVSGALLLCVVGATFAGTTVSADMQSRHGLESAAEGNWSGAISAFDSASTLAPYRPRYHWHLYRASFLAAQEQETLTDRARLFNSALYHILRAQELEPVNYYYVLEEARLEAFAALSIHESRDQEAVRLFKLAAQMSPKSVDVLNDWALYEMRNRRLPQALTLLQHSLSLDTEYGITHFLLGHIYSNFGQPDEAVLAFRDAIEYSPSYRDFYFALATSIYSEPQEALGPALRYAEAAPDDPRAHRSLVAIYEALGMGQEAQEHARLADTLSVLQ